MATDPAASMRVWAVELDLGGRVFDIPPLPAADWLPLLMEGDTSSILDLVEDPALDRMILSGEVEPVELAAALNTAIEKVAGRSIYQAVTLAQVAKLQWTVVSGDLSRRGFRWDEVSLAAALDAIHVTVLAHLRATPNDEETRAGLPSPAQRFQALMDQNPGDPVPVGAGRHHQPDRARALAQHEEMAGPKPPPVKATAGPFSGGRPKTRQQPRQRPRAGR